MKIIFFSSMPVLSSNGSPIAVECLARGLRSLGHDIAYVSHPQGRASEEQLKHEDDATFVDFTHHATIDAALEFAFNVHAPDHVLAVTYGPVDVLSRVCLRRGVPFSVDLHCLRMVELERRFRRLVDLAALTGSAVCATPRSLT